MENIILVIGLNSQSNVWKNQYIEDKNTKMEISNTLNPFKKNETFVMEKTDNLLFLNVPSVLKETTNNRENNRNTEEIFEVLNISTHPLTSENSDILPHPSVFQNTDILAYPSTSENFNISTHSSISENLNMLTHSSTSENLTSLTNPSISENFKQAKGQFNFNEESHFSKPNLFSAFEEDLPNPRKSKTDFSEAIKETNQIMERYGNNICSKDEKTNEKLNAEIEIPKNNHRKKPIWAEYDSMQTHSSKFYKLQKNFENEIIDRNFPLHEISEIDYEVEALRQYSKHSSDIGVNKFIVLFLLKFL